MADYDVIVIGAGNGGLSAAVTFAQAGKKVAMFEKHNIPGGCGTSFCRGRFEFEVALHQLSSMGTAEKPGDLRVLFDQYGITDKIDWIQIESLYKINLPGGKGVALPADRYKAEETLIKAFPEEKESIHRYYETVWKFNREIIAFTAKSANSSGEPSSIKKLIMKALFPKLYPTLAKYAVKSTDDVLNEFFKSKELQLCLSAYWCFMGMPPERFPFTILARCTYIYTEDKPYYLRGGSQVISQALTEAIKKAGGSVFFNTGVKKIVLKDGKASGIITEDGVEHTCKKIISNISPTSTYANLLDEKDIPKKAREYLKAYTVGISALTCFIGLDCPPETVGFTDSFNLTYDTLDANRDFMNSYELNTEIDPIVSTCYTVDDPSVSPKGTSIVTAGTLKYGEAWEKLSPEQYYKAKYDAANTIVDRLEKRYPGFRSHIEEMEVATPLTHMRYLNHPGGAIYGYEQDLKSSVFFFPRDTFIPNLDFASGWVNTCGFGPNYLYGNSVAKRILKEEW
ncbi:MAG: phytoene desaturase family protein [Treponema sp.]